MRNAHYAQTSHGGRLTYGHSQSYFYPVLVRKHDCRGVLRSIALQTEDQVRDTGLLCKHVIDCKDRAGDCE